MDLIGANAVAASKGSLRNSAGLGEMGVVVDRDVDVVLRWADGDHTRLDALARERVRAKVSLIVAAGGEPSAAAVLRATSTIPVVFGAGADPVAAGLVKSLSRPGGNATGFYLLTADLEGKRLEVLRQLLPSLRAR